MNSAAALKKPVKKLVILDKDNCELDTLEVFGVLAPVLEMLAKGRGLPLELLHDLTREANGEHRFNDIIGLISHMEMIEPRFRAQSDDHRKIDEQAKEFWLRRSAELSVFYPGVIESLLKWQRVGTNVVTKTDAERLPIIRRVWLTAQNACSTGQLQDASDIIPLYQRIYCKPSLNEPEDEAEFHHFLSAFCTSHQVPEDFAAALNHNIEVFRHGYKPAPDHLKKILGDFNTAPEDAIYIGDSHKDGLEAQSLNVDFAWSRYGTPWTSETAELYEKVGSKAYKYGTSEVEHQLGLHNVKVAVTLEDSFAEIFRHYEFTAGQRPCPKFLPMASASYDHPPSFRPN